MNRPVTRFSNCSQLLEELFTEVGWRTPGAGVGTGHPAHLPEVHTLSACVCVCGGGGRRGARLMPEDLQAVGKVGRLEYSSGSLARWGRGI